ncbi:MAG: hypothetical protein M1838_001080 [Thelocarpon superellum]|nr:MAG: hypothetical protein M1838_001080 [Thelocarpon superellum]
MDSLTVAENEGSFPHRYATEILPIDETRLGHLIAHHGQSTSIRENRLVLTDDTPDARLLRDAARRIRQGDLPVAFPTETVYGLGADATRSAAVRGIYQVKGRPSDNPLIVHVCSVRQLERLLLPQVTPQDVDLAPSPIPPIYEAVIQRFWPGPLTIILPNPVASLLAPEVTAGLSTFGARMPGKTLALALIHYADVPLAAPSANASTKPSPTTAQHVRHDLDGRIELIIDGGPCHIGVESTVVDGLSLPPLILRPGGVGIDDLRDCPGWGDVQIGYKDGAEQGTTPKAPGMKYKHYSPNASVILHEAGATAPTLNAMEQCCGGQGAVGIIRTTRWPPKCGLELRANTQATPPVSHPPPNGAHAYFGHAVLSGYITFPSVGDVALWEVCLGPDSHEIGEGLFSALREMDSRGVQAIFVEGIPDEGDMAAAVMNRLRKAAAARVFQ